MRILRVFDDFHDTWSVLLTSILVSGILVLVAIALGSYAGIIDRQRLKVFHNRTKPTLDLSNVGPLPSFDIANIPPYPYRPWKAGKYHMTMGLRKMPEQDWLVLDNLYEQEQELRRHLLASNRNGVMQYLPGSEDAYEETLECIVKSLTRRYPSQFQYLKGELNYIQILITNKTFKITAPFEQHPLEVAAQLTMEDIHLLIQGEGESEYCL